jgi:hypothetical protein
MQRKNRKKSILWSVAGLAACAMPALGQTDIYKPYHNLHLWSADTLYLGAGFVRASKDPVRIRLRNNDAGFDGELYFLDPATGVPVVLFSNHSVPGEDLDLSAKVDIPIGVTLTFMYKVVGKGAWKTRELDATVLEPKYTGPNQKTSDYVSAISSDKNVNPVLRFGRRWSVSGRVDAKTLEFGFEDDTAPTSDMDFDDIIFQVEGLKLALFQKSARTRYYLW